LNSDIQILKRLYDIVRLVNPVKKKVHIEHQLDLCADVSSHCYDFWETGTICENCISIRALNEGNVITKLEYNSEKVFMVMAMPMVMDEEEVVLEMLKDITANTIVDIRSPDLREMYRIIDKSNKSMIWDSASNTYNENYVYEHLPYDIDINVDDHTTLSVVSAGLDNLNTINNAYGRKIADFAIKEFAGILESFCRHDKDWLARYGNADFILVLPNTSDQQASRICRQMKKKINHYRLRFEGYEIEIVASFGFHTINNQIPAEDLLKYAEQNDPAGQSANGELIAQCQERFMDNHSFTIREEEVAKLILDGLSNQEIARRLYIGISTVKKHVSSIYHKAGVGSRSELLASYHQNLLMLQHD